MSKFIQFLIAALLVAIVVLLWRMEPKPKGEGGGEVHTMDEGDRPPIIISEGSVDIYLEQGLNGAGHWKKNSDTEFVHVAPVKAADLSTFRVYLLNATGTAGKGCDTPSNPFVDTAFTVEFNGSKKVEFSIDSATKSMKVVFPEKGAAIDTGDVWLGAAGEGLKLKNIYFKTLDTTCKWEGNVHRGVITVQSK